MKLLIIFFIVALTTVLEASLIGNTIVKRCSLGGPCIGGTVNGHPFVGSGNPGKRQTQPNGAPHVGTIVKRCSLGGPCFGYRKNNGDLVVGSAAPGKRHAKRGYECVSNPSSGIKCRFT